MFIEKPALCWWIRLYSLDSTEMLCLNKSCRSVCFFFWLRVWLSCTRSRQDEVCSLSHSHKTFPQVMQRWRHAYLCFRASKQATVKQSENNVLFLWFSALFSVTPPNLLIHPLQLSLSVLNLMFINSNQQIPLILPLNTNSLNPVKHFTSYSNWGFCSRILKVVTF